MVLAPVTHPQVIPRVNGLGGGSTGSGSGVPGVATTRDRAADVMTMVKRGRYSTRRLAQVRTGGAGSTCCGDEKT